MMVMWTTYGCLVTVFIVVLLAFLADGSHTDCASLQCLHGNPCLTTVSHGDGGSRPAHARCMCSGHWAGPRCQYRIHVTAVHVTSRAVHLSVATVDSLKDTGYLPSADSSSTPGGSVSSGKSASPSGASTSESGRAHVTGSSDEASLREDQQHSFLSSSKRRLEQSDLAAAVHYQLNYTITYWSNSSERACRLLQEITSPTPKVRGLRASSAYLFCVESGSLDTCAPSVSDITPEDTNCVKVITLSPSSLDRDPAVPQPQMLPNLPTVIVVTIVTVLLVIVVLTGALLFRWYNLISARQFCSLCCLGKREMGSFRRFSKGSGGQSSDYIHEFSFSSSSSMPLPPAVDFPPPSPDLAVYRNGNRRGRSHSARNSHRVTLEAVIEDPTGDPSDVTETSLMVPDAETYDVDKFLTADCSDVMETSLMMPSAPSVDATVTSSVVQHDMAT